MPLNTVNLTFTEQDSGGGATTGSVVISPSSVVTAAGVTVVGQTPVVRQFSGGTVTVTLVACDNTGTVPAAGFWAYNIQLPGWAVPQLYLVNFANGANQQFFNLTPVVAQTTFGPAASLGSPMTTLGDMIDGGTGGTMQRLAGPTAGTVPYVLTSTPSGGVAQVPAWSQLDQTTGDLQPEGAAAAGTSGKVPDAGHVHPRQPWQFLPESYGAKGNGKVIGDATIAGGALSTLTSASAAFTSNDTGKTMMINGASGTASPPLVTTITFVNSTTVTLANAAANAVTNAAAVYGTDDTAAINSAVSAGKTYATTVSAAPGSGGYFFEILFASRIYMVTAAPTQTSGAGGQQNAQIPIPWPAVNGLSQKLVISLKGAGKSGNTQYWESTTPNLQGTSIVSTQTAPSTPSGTFGQQSVIGGPSAGGAFTGSFANTKVIVDGITVWAGWGSNMYAWDFGYTSSMEWGSFGANEFAPAANLSGATAAHPYLSDLLPTAIQSTIGVGCRFPLVGNNDDVVGLSFASQGFNLPWLAGDHFTCPRVASVYCDASGKIDLINGISNLGHAVTILNWSVEQYNGGLTCNGGSGGFTFVNINMDTETQGGTADPVYDVNDPNGCLYGVIRITDSKGRTNRRPIVNGAANLKVINDMIGPGNWAAAPAAPTQGVAQQNTSWRDATVYVSSTASITSVVAAGVATGLTAASSTFIAVRVPSGASYTVNSAGGTLTTHWVLD